MKLWIDGDSFPRSALLIALQTAHRANVTVEVVSDRPLENTVYDKGRMNETAAQFSLVPEASGQTDDYIITNSQPGDIAATRDLELAERLLVKGLHVLNDRGKVWSAKSLARRLEDSRIMHAMRMGGMTAGRRVNYDRENALDFRMGLETLIAVLDE